MIAELKFEGTLFRFRVALISKPDTRLMDYELTCISDEFPDKLAKKRFDHHEFKKYWRDGSIRVEI